MISKGHRQQVAAKIALDAIKETKNQHKAEWTSRKVLSRADKIPVFKLARNPRAND